MKMMYLILLAILIMMPLASAKQITTTPSTEKICEGDRCTLTLYSGIRNVYEDGQWKKVEDARSLKGSGVNCIIDYDGENEAECLDWNATSVKLKLSKKNNGNSPIRIMRVEGEEKEKEISRKDYNFNNGLFGLFKDYKEVIIKSKIGDVIHFGEESTTITLQDANTENLEDTHIEQNSADSNYATSTFMKVQHGAGNGKRNYVKFDVSSISAGSTIESANISLYMDFNLLDDSGEGYDVRASYTGNQSWIETFPTWNNFVNPGELNITATDEFAIMGDSDLGWYVWDVKNSVQTNVNSEYDNITIIMLTSGDYGSPAFNDYITFSSKENAVSGNRPKLSITYSGGSDSTAPTFTDLHNISIYQNQSVLSYFNATDETAFDSFTINNTNNFSITKDGNLTNITGLVTGIYYINITINDSSNNLASEEIFINMSDVIIPDTTPPYFQNIHDIYLNQSQSVNSFFNATDETAFDSFTINNTNNFSITRDGNITNITSLAFQSYYVNVTINDSSNNLNSSVVLINMSETVVPPAPPNVTTTTIPCRYEKFGYYNPSLPIMQQSCNVGGSKFGYES